MPPLHQLAAHRTACYDARLLSIAKKSRGEVREWPNRRAWKARVLETGPWVQIPPSPPDLARHKLSGCQGVGSGAPDLPTGSDDERRKAVSPGATLKGREAIPLSVVNRSDRSVPGASLPGGSSSGCFYRAKSEAKGLGPVQQAPVNPARSGRKQR